MTTMEKEAMERDTAAIVARREFIAGLRGLAAYIEERPDLPVPPFGETLHVFLRDKDQLQQVARAMGHADKEFSEDWVYLIRRFGNVEVRFTIERQKICKRTVIGTREVPARTEEIVEWECSDSILSE